MISNRIKQLIKDKRYTLKEVAEKINVSETGFLKMLKNDSWKIETLRNISTELNIPIAYFLPDFQDTTQMEDDLDIFIESFRKIFTVDLISFNLYQSTIRNNGKITKEQMRNLNLTLNKYRLFSEQEYLLFIKHDLLSQKEVDSIKKITSEIHYLE